MSVTGELPDYIVVELPVRLKRTELAKLNDAAARSLIGAEMENGCDEDPLARARRRAATILRYNRSRTAMVGADLFSDPAWNMMLDLFVRGIDGEATTVSSACIGAGSPNTTALRHLALLVERQLVERRPSETDARVMYVRLTSNGYARMLKLLS